jgi:thioesterase domain-containing protein
MSDAQESAEARRALIEKYLHGELPRGKKPGNLATPRPQVAASTARERVISVQAQGTKHPFFYLHGDWTGNAFFCFRLAHFLGADHPFYILTPYDFNDLDILPTIEEMAAAHVKSMRAVQPEGPYLLGGFCNGGLTAYEMARQLYAQGERVDLLVLMDSIPPRTQMICAALRRYGKLTKSGQAKQLDWYLRTEHAYRYLLDKHSDDFEHISKSDARICAYFPPVETLRQEYPAMFTWATSNYQPAFYPGKVTLFWDEAELFRRKWWNDWAKGQDQEVEEHIIPGTHTTCKTEHIEGMAEHLRACLDQVATAAIR